MGKVVCSASVSLDGFVANPDNDPGPLFEWYQLGDVVVQNHGWLEPFHLTRPSADHWTSWVESLGALVVGRVLFDVTDGWKGQHPLGVPVIVLTHEPPTDWSYPDADEFHFVTGGIAEAIELAQRIAGDKVVAVAAGQVGAEALRAGLLDEVAMDLVPVVLGGGHAYFPGVPAGEILLEDPTVVVAAPRVTHLVFPVRRD